MEMFSSGSPVAAAVFNGTGSDKMNWMSTERLMTSPWDDIAENTTTKPATVSVVGRYEILIDNDIHSW